MRKQKQNNVALPFEASKSGLSVRVLYGCTVETCLLCPVDASSAVGNGDVLSAHRQHRLPKKRVHQHSHGH